MRNGKTTTVDAGADDNDPDVGVKQLMHKVVCNKGPPWWRSQRYILGYLIFGGMMNIFFQRINFSIGIVCMVNHTALKVHGDASLNIQQPVVMNAMSSNSSLLSIKDLNGTSSENNSSTFHDSNLNTKHQNNFFSQGNSSTDVDNRFSAIGGEFLQSDTDINGGLMKSLVDHNKYISIESQNSSSITATDQGGCAADHLANGESREDGPFVWDKKLQGVLLGAVYWTYLLVQVPGNHLVRQVKKKTVVMCAMSLMTVMTMLTHGAALWSPWAVFVVKLVQGGCTALTVIGFYGMWAKWAPPSERAFLISLGMSGQMMGNVLVFPVSALLCKYGFLGGWPSVFYVFGLIGIVWLVLYFIFVDESPSTHPFISEAEKKYITSSLPQTTVVRLPKTPWLSLLTSPALWAIVCAHTSFTWGLFLLLSTLPQYMYEVLKFDIKSNGLFTMLPYLALLLTTQTAGKVSDILIKRQILRVLWTRKVCIIIANIIPAISLAAMSFVDCSQPGLAITLLVIGVSATGFGLSGFLVNPYDIAPQFATVIITISNSIATIPGIITPYAVAAITLDQSREQWQIVFFMTSGIYVLGTVGFCVLARDNIQPWAMEETEIDVGEKEKEEDEESELKKQNEEKTLMLEKV